MGTIAHITNVKPPYLVSVNSELKEIKIYLMLYLLEIVTFAQNFYKENTLCFQFQIYRFSLVNVSYLMR